jgi:glycosyltransferase involved in cell wall biosynthesis
VHCHSPFSAIRVARTLARRRRAPLVATFHSKYRDDLARAVPVRALVDGRIRKIVRFFESADQVWIPSESAIETLRAYGYRGEVQVVPHGIDIEPPEDLDGARRVADGLLETGPDDRVLLYVGQIVWEKDLEVLVRAVGELAGRGVRFTAAMIGEGYARDEVAALAAELGVGSRLRLVGGVRDRDTLRACYARAELFVFPSRYDTSGLVVREAAGVGVPAVLVRGADTAEGIRDGYNGFLAEPDAASFAAAIERALADPELVRRAGREAMRTLCQPWRDAVEAVAERYRELVAAHQPDRSRPISVASAATSGRSSSATD